MTRELYETHILTKDLDKAIEFYKHLGMPLATYIENRRVAFFWFGDKNEKKQTLGVWEVSAEKFAQRHFAFKVDYAEIKKSIHWLTNKGIQAKESFGLAPTEPIVHTWMPAASVYFEDPDGNSLEFIHVLDVEPNNEKPIMYLSEWENIKR
ncbi:VOC family protein [Bacillus timonensis]|nr:VOC family protein [Bacillus timonensis]